MLATFVFAAALTTQVAASQPSDRFDLLCEGVVTSDGDPAGAPVVRRIRIDLEAGRWCADDCSRTEAIAEASADALVLDRDGQAPGGPGRYALQTVSRVTGAWRSDVSMRRPVSMWVKVAGSCRPAAFSGFPAAMF